MTDKYKEEKHHIVSNLTDRQKKILELVCSGLDNTEIGIEQDTGFKTVEAQMTKIMDIFGVTDRYKLMAKAFKLGIVKPEDVELRGDDNE